MQVTADMLKRQEREVGRNRHWRSNFKQLQRQLIQLEEDEVVLDSVFPQARFSNPSPAAAESRGTHGQQAASGCPLQLTGPDVSALRNSCECCGHGGWQGVQYLPHSSRGGNM
jgi:hypothetical protein